MYTPFDLTGQSAVVTGGNGGIGYGMARALLASGAQRVDLGLQPRRQDGARPSAALAAECGDPGPGARPSFATWATRPRWTATFCRLSVSALGGRVDACFANAGVSGKGNMLMDMTLAEFQPRAAHQCGGRVPHLPRRGAPHGRADGQGGALVATASTAAVEGAARNSHYGASAKAR